MTPGRSNDPTSSSDALLFLRSLRAVLGRTPLWLATWSVLLAISAALALPWFGWFGATTANRYEPGSTVYSLDQNFRTDHAVDLDRLSDATATTGAGLVLVAILIGIFAAGGWLQVILERTHGHSLRRFFYGGSRYFWRFFRFWVLTLIALATLHWTLYDWPWEKIALEWMLEVPAHDLERLEELDSERRVRLIGWLRDGLAALGFCLIMAWGVLSRTRIALHDTGSALWSGLCSGFTILRHPIKTLRPLLFLLGLETLVVVVFAGSLTRWLDAGLADSPTTMRVALMFVVGQFALLWREITRGANYYAAVKVSQDIVRPLSRPDPWKTIGGPGGPQYPVDGGDEYGVAL